MGKSISELANLFEFSTQTITRQLKIMFDENEFRRLKKNLLTQNKNIKLSDKKFVTDENIENDISLNLNNSTQEQTFFEVLPVLNGINLDHQKDLTSVPISDADFPKIVYMIVDKKIELVIKLLRDYPEWDFLSDYDLNRKTAHQFVNKVLSSQKAIKSASIWIIILDVIKLIQT